MPGTASRPVVAVAVSGGRDSTALLHAVWRQSAGTDLQIVALHVHHGLMAQADAWQAHLERQCANWRRRDARLVLACRRLQGRPGAGESVEAWARRERYAALAEMAREHGANLVLLAHHLRDQAETVLLQALRGAGPAGLAAMPGCIEREGLIWARPWLGQPAEAIAAYVRRHRLKHIEDDSNADTRFARNRLRLDLLPALKAAFPQAEASLASVARQAQIAAAVLDEIAAQDLALCQISGQGRDQKAGTELSVSTWLSLSAGRRRYVLRAWFKQAGRAAGDTLLERLLHELPHARSGALWPLAQGERIRLYRGALSLGVAAEQDAASMLTNRPMSLPTNLPINQAPPSLPQEWPWPQPMQLNLPQWGGCLRFRPVCAGGIGQALLAGAQLRPRQGGEQFQQTPGGMPRALKKQFQAQGIPAWARAAPLLVASAVQGGALLYVPGLGVDARHLAAPGEPQWQPEWSAGEGNLEDRG